MASMPPILQETPAADNRGAPGLQSAAMWYNSRIMRPCRHCNAAIENQQRRCPVCGGEVVATVGLDAPACDDAELPDVAEAELAEETLFRGVLLSCAGITTVGVPLVGWLAAGPVGLMIGVLALGTLIVGCQMCFEGLF
jgi:hypothetical protein